MGLLKWVCLKIHVFVVFLFVLSFSFCLSNNTYGNDDKSVLVQFKQSLSDPHGVLSSWNSDDHYCDWFGVLCDSNGRVTSLNISGSGTGNRNGRFNSSFSSCVQLSEFRLYGIGIRRNCISSNSTGVLIGSFSGVLSKLGELRVLSLPFNELSGEIPLDVWGMQKLEVIDLEGNLIKGTLPVKGVWLRSLRVLNLGFNGIEGELPSWLSGCQSLEVLNLVGNKLNGTIPASFGGLKNLRGLYLSLNHIGGSIPSDFGEGGCQGLEHLDFSGNLLFGKIPSSLSNCSNLQTLLLYSNMLEEVIPPELGMLKKLKVLDLSRNSLNGLIPVELGNCSELSVLVLSNLFDPFPESFDSREDSMNLVNDDFNYFQGVVPTEIIALPKLRMLWIPRATLEGRFPRNWGVCDNLEMINLAHNFISGNIPDEISLCKKLYFLDLSSNRLVGGLSQKLHVPCMTVFDVSGNFLSGPIPVFTSTSCLSAPSSLKRVDTLDDPSLQYVSYFVYKYQVDNLLHFFGEPSDISGVYHNFGSNNFSGTVQTIPIADVRMESQSVYAFLAGYNKLSMPFPVQLFANCNKLNALIINVSNNAVHGQIPQEIGAMCRNLKILDVSGNQINGSLVSGIGDLTSLVSLNLSWNLLQGQIPISLGQVKDLMSLSLAGNDLTGSIPSSLGLLQSLQFLDLSSNSLVGEIPKELVKLSNLTVLLLNDNKLFGQIPPGLANVTMLSAFNVSFNNLSGLLPLNSNLTKCNSLLGNPFLQSCRMVSLSVPSPDPQGIAANSQSGNDSTSVYTPPRANVSFNSIEIASITSASAIVSVLIALIILFFYTRKCNPKSKILGSPRNQVIVFTDIGVPLTFENVVRATGNFNASNCIGNGGFGATYKAEISPGVLVAIKRLAVGRFQGIQQFHAEIKTLGRLRHPNLVTLIGYHASKTEMFLIYNYLPGGNLERFIHERSTRAVDWRILHKIALDVARALAYLHDQCVPRVLHRDVKPSNILLDDDFNAYLSDFGLARLLGTSETHATTGVAGTFGYVAPEYAMTCRVSDKADVYSYGVVLLELLSDKKALDPSFSPYGNGFNIVAWACMLLRQGRAKEFFTAGLWEAGPHDDLVEVLHLAVVCTVDSLSTRPTMKQVVRRLKQLQPPSF